MEPRNQFFLGAFHTNRVSAVCLLVCWESVPAPLRLTVLKKLPGTDMQYAGKLPRCIETLN